MLPFALCLCLCADPAPRSSAAMTFDAALGEVLLFGGAGARVYADTWSWDGARWELRTRSGPSARDDAVLVGIEAKRRVLLFGGRVQTGGAHSLADTWVWDGGAWTRLDLPGPRARLHAAGAWDARRECVLVGGGVANDGTQLRDLWAFDGRAWTELPVGLPPEPVDALVFEPRLAQTLLVCVRPPPAGELWSAELHRLGPRGFEPVPGAGPRFSPLQRVTAAANGLLLFDGGALDGRAHTWLWRERWLQARPAHTPTPRNAHAQAYDPRRRRTVVFGGFLGGQDLGDTWEWDGADWHAR